jgi:hypothetical protein
MSPFQARPNWYFEIHVNIILPFILGVSKKFGEWYQKTGAGARLGD